MSKAVNTIARGIESGALKAGASQYMETLEKSEPYDPQQPTAELILVSLLGAGENPDEWIEAPVANIEVSGPAIIAEDMEVSFVVRYNTGKEITIRATAKEENIKISGIWKLSPSPFEKLSDTGMYTAQIDEIETIGIHSEEK